MFPDKYVLVLYSTVKQQYQQTRKEIVRMWGKGREALVDGISGIKEKGTDEAEFAGAPISPPPSLACLVRKEVRGRSGEKRSR